VELRIFEAFRSSAGLPSPRTASVHAEPGSVCGTVFHMRRYLDYFEQRQPVPAPRHVAFGIARHAGSANLRPNRINPARRRNTDLARQCRASFAVAAHPRQFFVDEFSRDQIECDVVLGGKPRPVRRVGTTRAAGLAQALGIHGGACLFHASGLARNEAVNHQGSCHQGSRCQVSLGTSQTRLLRHLARSRSRRSGYFSSR
jgi:hypothetical protein